MAQTSKKTKTTAAKAPTGKSASSLSNPKTPVQANGDPNPSGTSRGRPHKNGSKENEGGPVSPLARAKNPASLAPSSDPPAEEDLPSSVADENRVLRERLAKAELNLAAAQAAERKRQREENEEATCVATKKITVLARPKGEAGSAKKGFNLQDAMGLSGSSDKALLYNEIMRELRIQVQVVKLNPRLHFAQQDAEKLGHVYRKMRKTFEWLDNRRFPGDWAIADMIKHYLRGRRKKVIKDDKIKKQAEDERQAKERRKRHVILKKLTVLAEDDPESLAMEAANEGTVADEEDENWPPVCPHKQRRVDISPVLDESDVDVDADASEEGLSN